MPPKGLAQVRRLEGVEEPGAAGAGMVLVVWGAVREAIVLVRLLRVGVRSHRCHPELDLVAGVVHLPRGGGWGGAAAEEEARRRGEGGGEGRDGGPGGGPPVRTVLPSAHERSHDGDWRRSVGVVVWFVPRSCGWERAGTQRMICIIGTSMHIVGCVYP